MARARDPRDVASAPHRGRPGQPRGRAAGCGRHAMTADVPAPLAARVFAEVGLGVTVSGSVAAVLCRIADPAPLVPKTFGFGDASLVDFAVLGTTFGAVGGILVVQRSSNAVGWVMVVIGVSYAVAALAAAVTFSAVAAGPSAAGTAAVAGWWAMAFSTIG